MADTSLKKNSNKTGTKTAAKVSLGSAVEKAVTGSFNGVPEITFEEVLVTDQYVVPALRRGLAVLRLFRHDRTERIDWLGV